MNQEKITITITDETGASTTLNVSEDENFDLDVDITFNKKGKDSVFNEESLYSQVFARMLSSFGDLKDVKDGD
jgi:hypothetical protein